LAATTGTPCVTTLPQGSWAPWRATIGTTTKQQVAGASPAVVQRLSTDARGFSRQPCWPQYWAWRQVPVIGFQARNSAIA
jgi:hypothetical protein